MATWERQLSRDGTRQLGKDSFLDGWSWSDFLCLWQL